MKQIQDKIESSTQGILKEEFFGIDNLEIIFEILRNKLYKDPIAAICREISCNARDANREVNRANEPIEITFPGINDPNFRIKDHGLGITNDRMAGIFIKYGSSTKREDNTQTGFFGCGSKTPFAYSDTFTIITTCDDHKTRTYSAYIDSTRIGKLALLSEMEDSLTPTGTTIIIPVKSGDYPKFIDATLDATQYWDIKPILKGPKLNKTWEEISIFHAGDNWALRNTGIHKYGYYNASESVAIIDGIGYLIDDKHLPKFTNDQKKLLMNNFILYFGNGELSLSASRDSIHYDDRTQKLLSDRVSQVQKEVEAKITAKIQNQPTYREAAKLTETTKAQINFGTFLNKITWGGERVYPDLSADNLGDWAKITGYEKFGTVISCSSGKTRSARVFHFMTPSDTHETVFVSKIDRIPRYSVEQYFKNNPKLQSLKVLCMPDIPTSLLYRKIIKRKGKVGVSYNQKLFKMLNLAELPLIKVKATPKSKVKSADDNSTVLGYKMTGVSFYKSSNVAEVPNNGGIYVEYDPTTKMVIATGLTLDQRSTNWDKLETILGGTIYGFSKNKLAKLKPAWKTLSQAIEDKLSTLTISQEQLIADAQQSCYLSEYELRLYSDSIEKLIKLLDEKSAMTLYLKDSQRVLKSITDNKNHFFLLKDIKKEKFAGPYYNEYGRYGIELVPTPKSKSILGSLLKDVKNKYRLLTKINSLRDIDLPIIAEYINLIDQKKK